MTRIVLIATLLFLGSARGVAQDSTLIVRLTEIDISRFPSVLLKLHIKKPAHQLVSVSARNAHLAENSIPQLVEFFECPQDSSTRLSIAILLDRSSSMRRLPNNEADDDSTKIREAKKAIRTFIDLLGDRDEAAIFSFATDPVFLRQIFIVEHDFSTDKDALKGSLEPIVANGYTRLWEAIIDAVDLLRLRPGRKALVVVTDGRNRFGNIYRSTAFQRAVDEGIPVYPIGLGEDIDVGALSSLAAATGGTYYPVPDATDLEEIFGSLGSELITDDCVLRYTSSNPCLDGTRRDIELALSGIGFLGEVDSFYVLPRQLNPVTLVVESGVNVIARETAVIPLTVMEQFSISQPLSYAMTVGYDDSVMRFQGVRTAGTLSESRQVMVAEDTPGLLQIELESFLPAYSTGALCELEFATFARFEDTETRVEILDAAITGLCPMDLTATGSSLLIEGCQDQFSFGNGAQWIVSDGEEFAVPIVIQPRPTGASPFDVEYSVVSPVSTLELVDIDFVGTTGEQGSVLVENISGGVRISQIRVLDAISDTLAILRFHAHALPRVQQLALDVTVHDLATGCSVDMTTEVPLITIDGLCQPLVRRKRGSAEISSHPNPCSAATTIELEIPDAASVELFLLDARGGRVKTLLDSQLEAGSHALRVDMEELPSGEYLAVLRCGGQAVTHRIVRLR